MPGKKKSSTLFGGLTGRAEKDLKSRTNRIDSAVGKATGGKKKKNTKDKKGK
jgi:hypothetical protein